jgi:hypothetical protein
MIRNVRSVDLQDPILNNLSNIKHQLCIINICHSFLMICPLGGK